MTLPRTKLQKRHGRGSFDAKNTSQQVEGLRKGIHTQYTPVFGQGQPHPPKEKDKQSR